MEKKNVKPLIKMDTKMTHIRDWDNDGSIVMKGAKTIERYKQLRSIKPDCKECDCFFAFDKKQFEEGLRSIRQPKEGEKLVSAGMGLYGTRDGLDKFFDIYNDQNKMISKECDPQEVYFYEFNNHECMISYDGDEEAIKIVIDLWGVEIAEKLIRYGAIYSIKEIKERMRE